MIGLSDVPTVLIAPSEHHRANKLLDGREARRLRVILDRRGAVAGALLALAFAAFSALYYREGRRASYFYSSQTNAFVNEVTPRYLDHVLVILIAAEAVFVAFAVHEIAKFIRSYRAKSRATGELNALISERVIIEMPTPFVFGFVYTADDVGLHLETGDRTEAEGMRSYLTPHYADVRWFSVAWSALTSDSPAMPDLVGDMSKGGTLWALLIHDEANAGAPCSCLIHVRLPKASPKDLNRPEGWEGYPEGTWGPLSLPNARLRPGDVHRPRVLHVLTFY